MAAVIGSHDTGLLDGSLYLLNRDDQTREGEAGHGENLYVNVANGNLLVQHIDAYLPSQGEDYAVVRTYNSRGNWNEGVGQGWTLSSPIELRQITKYDITVRNADGSFFDFTRDHNGSRYLSTDGAGAYEIITYDKASKEYTLVRSDQTRLTFDNNGTLTQSVDTNGNAITYVYQSSKLVQVIDDTGHTVSYEYGGSQGSELTRIVDSELGVLVEYSYSQGLLHTVTDRNGDITTYSYNTDGTLAAITLPHNDSITADIGKDRVISFQYDPVRVDNAGTSQLLSYIWDAEGNPTAFEYQFYRDNRNNYNGGQTVMVNSLGLWRAQGNDAEYIQWRLENGYYGEYDINSYNSGYFEDASGVYYFDQAQWDIYRAQVDEIMHNHATWYNYDANGAILQAGQFKTNGGNTIYEYATRYQYDAQDNLIAIIDANGYALEFSDDGYWRDMRKDYGYIDAATGEGLLTAQLTDQQRIELAEFYTTHLNYDASGNLITRTDNEDNVTTFAYTPFNKIASETSAMGNALVTSNAQLYQDKRVELGYAADVSSLSSADVSAILGLYTTVYSYDANQNLIEIATPGGDLTRFEYDIYGNVSRKIVYLDALDLVDPAKQQVTQYFYDAYGNNVRTIEANAWSVTSSDDVYWLNMRREFGIVDANGDGKLVADLSTADIDKLTARYTTSNTFDLFGNLTSYTDANGGVTTYVYDNDNRLISVSTPEGHTTVYNYDSVGNRIGITDANGHTRIYVYDRNNMLIAVQDWKATGSTGGEDRTTTYGYDVVGNRTSVVDANGNEITYVYREDNHLMDVITPMVNDVSGAMVQYTTSYAYDAVGRRITVNDNNGNVTSYIYNRNGLIKQMTDPIGHVSQYNYDANLNQVQIIIGAQLAQALRRTLTYSYDEENQLIAEVDAEDNVTRYGYDAIGNRVQVIDANGGVYEFEYDYQNRQIIETRPAVTDPLTGLPITYTVVHYFDGNSNEVATTDENGNTTRVYYDNDNRAVMVEDANSIKTVYSYDANNNRTGIYIGVDAHLDAGNHVVFDNVDQAQITTYAYDEFNQAISKVDGMGNALASSDDARYIAMREQLGYVDALGNGKLVADLTELEKAELKAQYMERYTYDRNGNLLQSLDNAGNESSITYDALNRQITSTDALGNVRTTAYDGNGNQLRITDALGRDTTLTYDANNRLVDITDASGVVSHSEYDDHGNLLSQTEAFGTAEARTTAYQYDLNNRITTMVDPESHQIQYEYDAVGNRIRMTDAKGGVIQNVYDALNRVVRVIDPLSFETRYEYDGVGNRLSLTDANGGITRFDYDPGNRLIETTDAEGRVTRFDFDVRGNRVTQTTAYGTAESEVTTYEYDAENNLRSVIDANGYRTESDYDQVYNRISTTDGNGNTTSYAFDAINRMIQVTDALGFSTQYAYDAESNRVSITDALGRVKNFAYDNVDRLITETAADGVETTYTYDSVGNRASITYAANTADASTTTFVYNLDDQLVSQTDALGNTTSYQYDANHNQTVVTDANGNAATYAYDANDRVVSITDAEGYITAYSYDGNGNRVQVVDANGNTTTTYYNANNEVELTVDALGYATGYNYDNNGNLVEQVSYMVPLSIPLDPALQPVITPSASDQVVRFEYDSVNRLTARISAEGYRTEYVYDAVGNRIQSKQQVTLDGSVFATSYTTYDAVNRVISNQSAEGVATSYQYNAVGNRTRAVDGNGNNTYFVYDQNNRLTREISALDIVTGYEYDARGNRTALIESQGAIDERRTEFAFDSISRLTDTTNANGVVTHYEHDAVGNIIQRQDAYGTADERLTSFVYDNVNRLVSETSALSVVSQYTYDGNGNRVSTTLASGVADVERTLSFEFDADNQLVAEVNGEGERTEYVYDGAGNRIETIQAPGIAGLERHNLFEYDLDNMLVATVDALGVRTAYVYDAAGNKIQTTQAVGLPEQRDSFYVYDLDNRLTQVTDPEGGVTQYVYDGLGNQTQITNANGGVQNNSFDALGRLVSSLSAGGVLTTNSYDARGNITSTTQSWVDGSDARTTTYQYDLLDQQVAVTDAMGFTTSITYDLFGNQTYIINGQYLVDPADSKFDQAKADSVNTIESSFEFDAGNRMTAMIDAIGTRTEYYYDEVGNRTQVIETANTTTPRVTTYTFDLANRQLSSVNPEGGRAESVYDAVGNKIEERKLQSVDDLGVETWIINTYEFDANGNMTADIDAYGTRNEHEYDAMGNLTLNRYAAGTADERVMRMEYDFNNRLITNIDGERFETHYGYDSMGNRTTVTDALGRVAYYTYDASNNLSTITDPEGNLTTYTYDSAGNQTSLNLGGRVTQFVYNENNNVAIRIEPDGTETRYGYDSSGNMVIEELYADSSATTALKTTTYTYDDNNRLYEQEGPDGTITGFSYDQANNIITEMVYNQNDTNPVVRITNYQYDLNNRKTTITYDSDNLNLVQTLEYDSLGNIVNKTDANGVSTAFSFDLNNRVVLETRDPGGLNLTTSSDYDAVGNLISQTDARGNTTNYVYNDNNQQVQIILPEVNVYTIAGDDRLERPTYTREYDAFGNMVHEVDPNGFQHTYYYDSNNRIVAEINGHNTLREYSYNAQGDQTEIRVYMSRLSDTDHNPNVRPASPAGDVRVTQNVFDIAGRITQTIHPSAEVATLSGTEPGGTSPVVTTQTVTPTETWTYDVFGNQVEYFDKNGNRNVYYYDITGNMTASVDGEGYLTEWDYDSQDNVLAQRNYVNALNIATVDPAVVPTPPAGNVYEVIKVYDNANRLIEERSAAFEVYDPVTPLMQTQITRYTYDNNGNQLSKTIASGTSAEITDYSYYDSNDNLVAVINGERVLHLYAYDANGNATLRERLYNTVAPSVDLSTLDGNTDFRALVAADGSHDQVTSMSYDAVNRLTSQTDLMGAGSGDDLTQTFKYNATQFRTYTQDEDGNVTRMSYNGLGLAEITISPDGSGNIAEYDAVGNQISGFMGQVENQTVPATNITSTLGDTLNLSWDLAATVSMGSRVVYGSTNQTTTSGYSNQTGLIGSWGQSSGSAAIDLSGYTAGDTVYFRVITQDQAGNISWTEEKSISIPPRVTDVSVDQPTASSITVTGNFTAGAQSPVMLYGAVQNPTTAVNFVLQPDGSYQATITGISNAQDLAFKIQWQDATGQTYTSSEQTFAAQGEHTAVISTVSEGTVSSSSGTGYTMTLQTEVPTALGQDLSVVMAEWREVGSGTGYSSTANASEPYNGSDPTYQFNLTMGSASASLTAGNYEVLIWGVDEAGTSIILDTLTYTVGEPTPQVLTSQSVSWAAPTVGNSQLVIVDGLRVDTTRSEGFASFDANVIGSQGYDVFYSDAFTNSHTTSVSSTEQTTSIWDSGTNSYITVVTGYNLDISSTLSAEEVANINGPVTLEWRSASDGLSFSNSQTMTLTGNTLSSALANVAGGQYDIKISYTDTNGNPVVVDWYRADTTVASASTTDTSQTMLGAEERGGSISLNANGIISVDPGLYIGSLDAANLASELSMTVFNTGNAGGRQDGNGLTNGYFTEQTYNALGYVIAEVAADGLYYEYDVDANGNRVATHLYGEKLNTSAQISYTAFDARDRAVAQFDTAYLTYGGSGIESPVTRYSYNLLDKVASETGPNGLTTTTEYNALGLVTRIVDANGGETRYQYDIRGNEVKVTDALGNTARKEYDASGRVTAEINGVGDRIEYTYDSFGRRLTLTKGGIHTTDYQYDQRNRMTSMTDAENNETRYEYDGRNNQTWVSDARFDADNSSRIYKYGQHYDSMGQVDRIYTYQDGNLITERKVYDYYGNVISEVDGEGRIKTTVYGQAGRVIETVDETGQRILKQYDTYGNLSREYDPTGGKNIYYIYDSAGNQTRIFDVATKMRTIYSYDIAGNRVREQLYTGIDPQGETTHNRNYTYAYDNLGNLQRWQDSVTGMHLNYQYDAAGNLQRVYTDLGFDPDGKNVDPDTGSVIDPNFRHVDHWYYYDSANRISSITDGLRGDIISEYAYDAAGNRDYWNNKGTSVDYIFDGAGRVTSGIWYTGTGTSQVKHEQRWVYDEVGNVIDYRTYEDDVEQDRNQYSYYENNIQYSQITADSTTTSSYDRSGRLNSKVMAGDGYTITYNYNYYADGREKSVIGSGESSGSASYAYDANNNQVVVNLGRGNDQIRAEVSTFMYDNEGHIVYKWHDTGKGKIDTDYDQGGDSIDNREIEKIEYLYANGNAVGETGINTDGDNVTKLDIENYSSVKNIGDTYPSTTVTLYTVNEGDTLQSIANAMYGNPSLWFVIAEANGLMGTERLDAGRQLQVPNSVQSGRINSETHALYSESDIIGSTLPNLQSSGGGGGGCGALLAIVVVVAIAIIAPYAVAALAGTMGGGILAYAVAGAVVYAGANVVQQGLLIALGVQESFDWGQVGTAAVSGLFAGLAQGVQVDAIKTAGDIAEVSTYSKIASSALKVASVASKQYMTDGKITSWTGLVAAGAGQYLSFPGKAAEIAGNQLAAAQQAGGDVAAAQSALNSANNAMGGLESIQTAIQYATPWVQLAETYVRNDGELTPLDWAGAVASTLTSVANQGSSPNDKNGFDWDTRLGNAGRAIGVNFLVAGALKQNSHVSSEQANQFFTNAVGNEVGTLIGERIGYDLKTYARDRSLNDLISEGEAAGGEAPASPDSSDGRMIAANSDVPLGYGAEDKADPVTHTLAKGDSLWNIAQQQLGEGATDADILAYTQQLMEVNPGLDPRSLQPGTDINLATGNETVSAVTKEAYNASDAALLKDQADAVAAGGNLGTGSNDNLNGGIPAGTGLGIQKGIDNGIHRGAAADSKLRLKNYDAVIAEFPDKYAVSPDAPIEELYKNAEAAYNARANQMEQTRQQLSPEGLLKSENMKPSGITFDEFVAEKAKNSNKSVEEIYRGVIESSGRPNAAVSGTAKVISSLDTVGKGLTVVGVGLDAYSLGTEVNKSLETGNWNNTGREAARITGGWTGAWAGAEAGGATGASIGGAIGVWFGGFGAAPGAAIGGFVGGIVGGISGYWGGSNAGEYYYDAATR